MKRTIGAMAFENMAHDFVSALKQSTKKQHVVNGRSVCCTTVFSIIINRNG